MSLGFNLGQTGNASEVGAGVVKLATQAQIDAGQADDAGVPLVVTPDKIPQGGAIGSFNAYEDIAAGDAVGLSHYFPQAVTEFNNTTNNGNIVTVNTTEWHAQEFVADASYTTVNIKEVGAYLSNTGGLANFTLRIRETLTGPDLLTATPGFGNTSFSRAVLDISSLNLVEGNSYFYIVSYDVAPVSTINIKINTAGNTPPTGVVGTGGFSSSDGGASWTPQTWNMAFNIVSEDNFALGHYEVFKANAAAVNSNRFAFYGYAKEAALTGQPVEIIRSKLTEVHTGLTPGRRYFLQDTDGLIGTTPGTIRIDLGRAISATQLYRDIDQSYYFDTVSGAIVQYSGQINQIQGGNTNSRITIYDRLNVEDGEISFTGQRNIIAAESEGGAQGVRFGPGNLLVSDESVRATMIYPEG